MNRDKCNMNKGKRDKLFQKLHEICHQVNSGSVPMFKLKFYLIKRRTIPEKKINSY